ncbi:MAG: acyl-CoA dehydrogenase family protein [Sphingopyxis sp.]|nr:acyl-CoA dehydrogenase family protein [Sphingopyxis sp.]
MNFQFSDEAEALRDQARKFLAERADKAKARAVMESGTSHDAALWAEIVALGWPALRIPEEHGGLGLSILDLCVLAEEVGRALAPVPFTSSVLLATEALLIAGTPEQQARWLPKLAEGSAMGTVALSAKPVTGDTLAPVHDAAAADFIIFTAPNGLHLIETAQCKVEPVETVDLVRRASRVTLTGHAAPMAGGSTAAEAFQHSAAILLAFEGLGGADAAMEMALGYTQQRVAFGRKIAGYQAVKHRLADMYIKNQLARSHAYYGAWALSTDAPELAQAAAGARLAAIDAYQFAAEENVQLHGGIGFTWESDCQFFYRRARTLTLALGGKALWADRLVRALEQRNSAMAA